MARQYTAWVIARFADPVSDEFSYLTVSPKGIEGWVRSPSRALQLARRVDARNFIANAGWQSFARPVEKQFG